MKQFDNVCFYYLSDGQSALVLSNEAEVDGSEIFQWKGLKNCNHDQLQNELPATGRFYIINLEVYMTKWDFCSSKVIVQVSLPIQGGGVTETTEALRNSIRLGPHLNFDSV